MTARYEQITLADVASFPRPGTTIPANFQFTPDGRGLCYLFSADGSLVRSLWYMDLETGERRILAGPEAGQTDERALSREEELRRERARMRELGVTAYEWAREGNVLLVPSGGRLLVSRDGEPLRALPGIEGAIDPHLNRTGTQVAFVRDGELFVADTDGAGMRQLTSGAEDGLTHGLAEFIAQEELDRSEGFWWAPDGSRITFVRADSRHIPRFVIVHQGGDRVELEEHRYPFAGEANAKVELGLVDTATGEVTWLALPPEDGYLARAGWRPDGAPWAQWLSRDQQTLRTIVYADGPRTLYEEHTEPWLNLDAGPRFLKSGEIVATSEASGFRHIVLRDASGREARPLTAGDWVVTGIVRVDETRRSISFTGTKDGVLERHLYAVSLDGGEVRRLSDGPGWHGGAISRDGRWLVEIHGSLERAPSIWLRDLDQGTRRPIFENDVTAAGLGLAVPELATFPAPDGTELHAAIYRPPAAPGRRHPVIVSVYGGPHAQRVADDWSLTVDLRAQYLAREGYIVLKVDNRGSANRGLAFEAHLARRMGTVEVEDQVAGLRWLEARGEADVGRVGIYGWSYGGYMTVMCMVREPGLFRAGVAGAPVSDWDGYDTGYTERYMSTPRENPDGYREASLLTHADRLEGALMLMHGAIDENVHFRHTARLITALTAAQKTYDLVLFPGERHMPRDAKGLEYQERRLVEHFRRHLA